MGQLRGRAQASPRPRRASPHTLRTDVERPDDVEPLPDDFLTLRVKEAFGADVALQNVTLGVDTLTGIVWLSGPVGRRYQILRAIELAKSVSGVRGVRNRMELTPVPDPA